MKKILSVLLLMTFFAQYAFCIEAEASTADAEQIETVYQLGIMSENQDDENDLSQNVTRAEFAEILYNIICNGESISGATKSYYKDIDVYHYAAPYIQSLTERAIIYGYDDGNFYPDKNITANEAVAMILRAIGYDIQLSSGKSVREVAWDADIGGGLDFSADLTKEGVIQIIYDTLYADTLKANLNVGISKAETVMFNFLDLEYNDGVVDGIDGKSLYGYSIEEGIVSIDEKQYTIACPVDESLLGKYVRYYYNEEDEIVKAIVPKKNTTLVIDANAVINSSNTEIQYYNENEKRKKAKIDISADILYNGDVVSNISENIPENGEITLIDRRDNGVYDVVFITEYTSYSVSRTSEKDKFITLYNTSEGIDLTAYEKVEIIDQNGTQLEVKSLTPDTVISVYKSGTKSIRILTCDEVVTGVITGIAEDDYGKTVIKLGEDEVKLYDTCYLGGFSLSVGANVTIHLDVFGIGVAVKNEAQDDWQFGYITSMKQDDFTLSEDAVRLKVLTMNGEVEKLFIVDKTRVDGVKIKIEDAMTYFNNAFNNFEDEIAGGEEYKKELVTTRLIRFKRDKNVLTHIDTPLKYSLYDNSRKPVLTENDKLLIRVKGNLYRPENQRGFKAVYANYVDLQGELFYTEKTPIFLVPTEENTDADIEDYTVVTGKDFYSATGGFIYISAYYTDINSFSPDVIVARKDTFASRDTGILVVNKKCQVYDEYVGEVFTEIQGYIDGTLKSMYVDEKNSTVAVDKIKQGDCIAYESYNNQVKLSQLLYRAEGGGALNSSYYWSKNNAGSNFNVGYRILIGKAGHVDGKYLHLKIDSESKVDELVTLTSGIVFYDSSEPNDALSIGDYTGIRENDIVIVSSRLGRQQEVVVIK